MLPLHSWLSPFHPPQVLLPEDLLELVSLPHDDSEVHGSGERCVEHIFGVDFVVESVHGDDYGGALEAFETGDRAVEDVVGGPQVLPVSVAVGVASLGVDGVATLGGQERNVLGEPALLLGEELDDVVGGFDDVLFVGEDEAHG